MGNYDDIVTSEENDILQNSAREMQRLLDTLQELPAEPKADLAKRGMGERLDYVSKSAMRSYKVFHDIAKIGNECYAALKALPGEGPTTHQFITGEALKLLGGTNPDLAAQLVDRCMDPDTEKDLWEVAYEGHFYGKIGDQRFGNFLPRVFPKLVLAAVDHIDNIHETAKSNFCKHYGRALKDPRDHTSLARAIHYLQDITAPHHAGNMAIALELITDRTNTHHFFEKYARRCVTTDPGPIDLPISAERFVNQLRPFSTDSARLADEVYSLSAPNVPNVKTEDRSCWDQAIRYAIPLAVAATAVVLQPWTVS